MVVNGWALACRRYSLDYVHEEADARTARRGIWASEFVKPWEWRRTQRQATHAGAPGECRIKGNINREGERIYHVPGGRWYDQTEIDPPKGEKWFYSEPEARVAGWRPAGR